MTVDFTRRLSECLAGLRSEKGWTLDQLAAQSGVSRAALSRLENAEVSPSAEVLSRLAEAYGVAPSRLLAMVEDRFAAKVPRDTQAVMRDNAIGFSRRVVSPPTRGLAGEVRECRLAPGGHWHEAEPLVPGQEHHLVMLSGALRATVDGGEYDLEQGDALRYRPYGPVRLAAKTGQGAKYILVLVAS